METKMLCLSTAHVTKETADLMDNDRAGTTVYKKADADGQYGWFVPAVPGTLPLDAPDDLQDIILFALDNGYEWVMFDSDAQPDPRFPVYRWPEADDVKRNIRYSETLVEMSRHYQWLLDTGKVQCGAGKETDARSERDRLMLLADRFEKEYAFTDWDAPGAPDYYDALMAAVEKEFGALHTALAARVTGITLLSIEGLKKPLVD